MLGKLIKDIKVNSEDIKSGTIVFCNDSFTSYDLESPYEYDIYCTDGTNDFFTSKNNINPIDEIHKAKELIYLINKL